MTVIDRALITLFIIVAGLNAATFFVNHDIDKLVIAVLFLSVAVFIKASGHNRATIASQHEHIAQLEKFWAPIQRHEQRFADMPRVNRGPLDVPPGHPEYRGGKR